MPSLPMNVSLPSPPSSVSLLPRPSSTLSCSLPVMVSTELEPVTFSMPRRISVSRLSGNSEPTMRAIALPSAVPAPRVTNEAAEHTEPVVAGVAHGIDAVVADQRVVAEPAVERYRCRRAPSRTLFCSLPVIDIEPAVADDVFDADQRVPPKPGRRSRRRHRPGRPVARCNLNSVPVPAAGCRDRA